MNRTCPNHDCQSRKSNSAAKISPFGYYKTKAGKRRRFRCQICRTTFSSTAGTPYFPELRRFGNPQHFLHWTTQFNDPAINFLPNQTNDMLRSNRRIHGKPIGHSQMSLQLPQTASRLEIRTWDTQPSHANRARETQTFIPRCVYLPFRHNLDEATGIKLEKKARFCGNQIPNSHLMTEAPRELLFSCHLHTPMGVK